MKTKLALASLLALVCLTELNAQINTSYDQNSVPIYGNENSAFGYQVLLNQTVDDGYQNTGVGFQSLYTDVNGSFNTAEGAYSLYSNDQGSENTAVGDSAMYSNTDGMGNTAIGQSALFHNTTGASNLASGYHSLYHNTSGDNNIASGTYALYNNTTGSGNIAIGDYALVSNTANDNIALGHASLGSNTTGDLNISMGWGSLMQNTSGIGNCSYGSETLAGNISGSFNAAYGIAALTYNGTGDYNTGIGSMANVSAGGFTNATALGYAAVVQGSDLVQLGDANVTQIECWSGTYATTSDSRFKNKISENDIKGLEFIKRLRPVAYNMDTRKLTEFMVKNLPDSIRRKHLEKNFENSSARRHNGFIAQEVEKAARESDFEFDGVNVPKDENGHYSVSYAQFVVPLVKGMQEQQAMIEELQNQINEQKQINSELLQKLTEPTALSQNISIGSDLLMGQNEPNPFTHETVVKYNLPQLTGKAYMAIYDLTGKQISSFTINDRGSSAISISAEKLPAGIYIYSIVADGKIVDSKRMVVAEK